jgi:hypothetical protein
VAHSHETQQLLWFYKTNTHHQNEVIEWAIQSIFNCQHALERGNWCYLSVWTMMVQYAVHIIYNHTPKNGVSPTDTFQWEHGPRRHLLDQHMLLGCPVYILDPKIQQEQKLPRWQP